METKLTAIAVILALGLGGILLTIAVKDTASKVEVQPPLGSFATSSTRNTAKTAIISMQPLNGATSSSLLNSDSNDRIITRGYVSCTKLGTSFTAVTGAALASDGLIVRMATSSTNAPAVLTNNNNALFTTVATTTPGDLYVATSTWTGGAFLQRWAAGSYLTAAWNATNSAQCILGVDYIGS